ncbi:hypothetical protein GCM10027610_083890 [Dactylosporangium cerinum]
MLDEEATAASSAEAGMVLPQFRQQGRRTARLTILVCNSPTMRWWSSAVDELIEALPLSGAFRSVRVWRLSEDSPVRLRPWNGDPAQDRDLATLVDHTGRQVTLLVTDGQGPAGRAAEITEMLTGLAALGPTAVLQVLPTHLWHQTWMRQASAKVSVVRGLATVAAGPGRRTPVVPVLRLEPSWLAAWTRLVGGTEAHNVPLTVLGPLDHGKPHDGDAGPDEPGGWVHDVADAAQQIQRFRAVASLTAYRLACHLAVAPLTVPVMQLVQAHAVPDSGLDHLAEVGVSGLLVRRDEPRDDEDPAGVVYEYARGVQRELLGSMPRSQIDAVVRILGRLPRSVTDPLGGRLNLPAIADELASADGAAVDPRRLPWARVATTVLRALGGSNRAVAEQIERNIAEAGGRRLPGAAGTARTGRADLPAHVGVFLRVLRAVADPWSQPGGAGSHGRLRGPLDEIAPLAAWLAAPTVEDRLRVLVGPAGSGKSTVVAAALAAVHPMLRDEPLPGPLRAQLPECEPAQARILAIDAAFLSCDEVRAALTGQAGAAGEELSVVLDRFGSACAVVLDGAALAADPRGLLELVVAPILRDMACRVLVVTTPTAALDDFLDALPEARGTVPVRLPAADRELLRERLLDVLATHPEFGRAGLQETRRALAAAGADHLGGVTAATGVGGLLAAGVVAADAAAQHGTEPATRARVEQLAAGHLPLLFETHPVLQGRPDLRLVFVVAAFARGGGMPLAVLRMCARRLRPGSPPGPDDEPPVADVQDALKALRYFLGVEQRADAELYSRTSDADAAPAIPPVRAGRGRPPARGPGDRTRDRRHAAGRRPGHRDPAGGRRVPGREPRQPCVRRRALRRVPHGPATGRRRRSRPPAPAAEPGPGPGRVAGRQGLLRRGHRRPRRRRTARPAAVRDRAGRHDRAGPARAGAGQLAGPVGGAGDAAAAAGRAQDRDRADPVHGGAAARRHPPRRVRRAERLRAGLRRGHRSGTAHPRDRRTGPQRHVDDDGRGPVAGADRARGRPRRRP